MGQTIPPPLNDTTPRHPWQEHFVCPPRPSSITFGNRVYPQYIPPAWKVKGITIREGQKVALRAGRPGLVGDQLVFKPQGKTRTILSLRDYRFYNQFDVSVFQIVRGNLAVCTPYPADRTASHARIAEGTFPLADLTLIESH